MSLKPTGSLMAELSVFELLDQFNFFVPEIQREYVWGKNNRNILGSFCEDIIEGKITAPDEKLIQKKITALASENKYEEIAQLLKDKESGNPLNIGFLYSYKPSYSMEHFPDSDVYADTYLIDGQQRFTTLFLLLFYLAVKEGRLEYFTQIMRVNKDLSSIAFDYRVRTLTHNFILKLVSEVTVLADFKTIKKSIWYLDSYEQDVSISSMVNALEIIEQYFKIEPADYFDFILNQIRFWHFKTEKTNQGEDLYITMNSRGKQLEENETVRAKLFEKINNVEQASWSAQWEEWQDFFWKNKGNNKNADLGFNEFLKCVAGLQSYLKDQKTFVPEKEDILDDHLFSNLSLEVIKSYFSAFKFIRNSKTAFAENYEYSGWLKPFSKLFDDLILKEQTNWFVDYKLENEATERRRLAFMWSSLYYLVSKIESETLETIFRYLRINWVRYNNSDRSVDTVKDRVEESIDKGIWSVTTTDEEVVKHNFFLKYIDANESLRKFESRIWKIEDHRLNLNGYQVENVNSSHLINYSESFELVDLDTVYNKFIILFPESETQYSSKINDVLMFYGFYGFRRSPWYYYNLDFGSWRRIVRDLDSEHKGFTKFFRDFDGHNLESLLEIKKEEFLKVKQFQFEANSNRLVVDNRLDTIRLYILLCDSIWEKGRAIAYEERVSEEFLPTTFEQHSTVDKPNRLFYNTKGTFHSYKALFNMLPENYLDRLKKIIHDSKT